jgi:hypothetical protein
MVLAVSRGKERSDCIDKVSLPHTSNAAKLSPSYAGVVPTNMPSHPIIMLQNVEVQ